VESDLVERPLDDLGRIPERGHKDRTFQVLAFPGLVEGRVPESVYRSVGDHDG